MLDDSLLVGRVAEVRGTKVRARVFNDKNEAYLFHHGELVKSVTVGGYVKIPFGYDQIIGRIEGEFQTDGASPDDSTNRSQENARVSRMIEISVFGIRRRERFDRGITALPLVASNVYVLTPEELASINANMAKDVDRPFKLGTLAGQSDVPVLAPASALFASHIGVFGNTGSGKSNTLCKFYTDCFDAMRKAGTLQSADSKFIVIDFNGEYTSAGVLCQEKKVYEIDTSSHQGGDRIPVPDDFYFDLETWSILTQATEKTQQPFLKACLSFAGRIREAHNPESYLGAIIDDFLGGYCGHVRAFTEQQEDFIKCMAYLVDKGDLRGSEDKIRAAIDDIEVFNGTADNIPVLRGGGVFGNDAEKVRTGVFGAFQAIPRDVCALVDDTPSLIEFAARFQFLQRWRSGSISRDHIANWLPRLANQMKEARKIYAPVTGDRSIFADEPVTVYSLLNANQDQKKLIPLVVAKYAYREQRRRGQSQPLSSVHLIVDEAHNILSHSSQRESESWRDYRLETFEEIVKEGRKFGMYLTVSSQRPSDISPTIVSQMHNYFIHRLVNDDDLRAIAKAVSFIDAATSSMIPVLPQGACIASGTAIPYPTQIHVERMPTAKQPKSADRDLAAAWGFNATAMQTTTS